MRPGPASPWRATSSSRDRWSPRRSRAPRWSSWRGPMTSRPPTGSPAADWWSCDLRARILHGAPGRRGRAFGRARSDDRRAAAGVPGRAGRLADEARRRLLARRDPLAQPRGGGGGRTQDRRGARGNGLVPARGGVAGNSARGGGGRAPLRLEGMTQLQARGFLEKRDPHQLAVHRAVPFERTVVDALDDAGELVRGAVLTRNCSDRLQLLTAASERERREVVAFQRRVEVRANEVARR